MLIHQGIYFPDDEIHMVEWMNKSGEIVDGRGTYQIKKLRAAMLHCKSFRTAVDIGGHVGLWSMHLAKRFETLHAFEPVAAHRECYRENMNGRENYILHACALGEKEGSIRIETTPNSSGGSRVAGSGDIPMHTLDSFRLQDVDFIKIDTEGYELYAVRGAEETIKRCRPVMVVEQKGHGTEFFGFRKEEAVETLQSWGMKALQAPISGDWIMGW